MFAQNSLDLFRCLYCGTLAAIVCVRLPADLRFLRCRADTRNLPLLLGFVAMPRVTPGTWLVAATILVALLAGGSAGVVPSVILLAAAIVALVHFAQLADSPVVHRKANTVPVVLALLALAAFPTDVDFATVSSATRTVVKLLLAQTYFSAGFTKLRESGWRWTDGQTLRRWLAYYHLRYGSSLALALAASPRLCRLAATFTLAFELTFWVVIVFPSLAWIYLPAAFVFHASTAGLMRIHYWVYLGPAYLVFVAEWLVLSR